MRMRVALVGSRWFGAQVFGLLLQRGHDVAVVGLKAGDQLTQAAEAAESPLLLLDRARLVGPEHLPDDLDVIVAAHAHAFIAAEACAKAKRAAIGYHPSLLPRHRGIAAVEWTIRCRDPIAGGSMYHLTDGLDGGPTAAQDWCFVYPDDDANSLWRRALGPMGLRLLTQVVDFLAEHGYAETREQDPRAATSAPALKAGA